MTIWESNISGDVNVLKKRMRARMSAIRQMLGEDGRAGIDAKIAEKTCAHEAFQLADYVFTYLSVGTEIDTRQIIRNAWAAGRALREQQPLFRFALFRLSDVANEGGD